MLDIVWADQPAELRSGRFRGTQTPLRVRRRYVQEAPRGTRSCPTQVQVSPWKGTSMPSGADVRAKVPAVGARDIWKRSFHSSENTAQGLGHGEELTLKELRERLARSHCWRLPS